MPKSPFFDFMIDTLELRAASRLNRSKSAVHQFLGHSASLGQVAP
jgi:hypothetical protein